MIALLPEGVNASDLTVSAVSSAGWPLVGAIPVGRWEPPVPKLAAVGFWAKGTTPVGRLGPPVPVAWLGEEVGWRGGRVSAWAEGAAREKQPAAAQAREGRVQREAGAEGEGMAREKEGAQKCPHAHIIHERNSCDLRGQAPKPVAMPLGLPTRNWRLLFPILRTLPLSGRLVA
jgi:hypothetical protein